MRPQTTIHHYQLEVMTLEGRTVCQHDVQTDSLEVANEVIEQNLDAWELKYDTELAAYAVPVWTH